MKALNLFHTVLVPVLPILPTFLHPASPKKNIHNSKESEEDKARTIQNIFTLNSNALKHLQSCRLGSFHHWGSCTFHLAVLPFLAMKGHSLNLQPNKITSILVPLIVMPVIKITFWCTLIQHPRHVSSTHLYWSCKVN